MREIICFLFGHIAFTYNGGTDTDPEQAWACHYCDSKLEYGDEYWGLNLNWRITNWLYELNKKDDFYDRDLPF